jgi:hypothetical protein
MDNRYMNAKEASTYLGLPIMELYRKDQLSQLLSQQEENKLFDNQNLNKAA